MMRVADVMTVAVITADLKTPVVQIARMMYEHGVGAIPIVEEGTLLGLVARADLLPFEEDPDRALRAAEDVMSRDLVTVAEAMTVAEAARVMAARGVKRAPVLRGGRLVGIISESDLLRPYLRTDGEIRADLEVALAAPALGIKNGQVNVGVTEGMVTVRGALQGDSQRGLLLRVIRSVEGVASVVDQTTIVPSHEGSSNGAAASAPAARAT